MHTATGFITAVQEERFRLQTDDGRGFLLTLHRNSPLTSRDLHRLHAANTRVTVEYEGQPNLANGVAYTVARTANGAHAH